MLCEITPSDNADMSNEKGIYPRLKLMVFFLYRPLNLLNSPKGLNDEKVYCLKKNAYEILVYLVV